MQTVDLLQFSSSSKRRKLKNAVDLSSYLTGSIIRIRLRNFMSYSLSEFQMAPNLNMIIGPNGTGKSTVVCAICLGLAGKTEYLGKPTMQFSQFVKQGQSTAIVEIELKDQGDEERVIIRREIDSRSSKSTWQINKRDSNEKQVKLLVQSLGIQLHSLCQFLAQDRVSKFAGQKPSELLKEIERSFSNGELFVQHEQIIQVSEKMIKVEKEKTEIEGRLVTLTRERESLMLEVEKFKRYQEKKKDFLLHKKLIPFVRIQDAKLKFSEAKKERDLKVKRYKLFEEEIKPLSTLINQFADDASNLGEVIEELEAKESRLKRKIEDFQTACKKYDSDISALEEQLRRKLTEIVKKSRKLESLQSELKDLEEKKISAKEALTPENVFNEQAAKRRRLQDELNEIRRETETYKERIRLLKEREMKFDSNINDLKRQLHTNDKLNVLSGRDEYTQHTKTLNAIKFLRHHKEKFEGRLFEPAVVSLSVQKGYGVILGNIVSLDSQLAIVTTSEENHKYVTNAVMDRLKLNVSFRQVSSKFSIDNSQRYTRDELKRLGFDGYLTDFIDGPKQVIQMLCEQHNIHLIPVSTRLLSPQQLEKVQNDGRALTFVSGDQILRTFFSSYGSKRPYSTASFLNPTYKSFESKGLSEDARKNIELRIQNETEKQLLIVEEVKTEKEKYDSKKEDYNEIEANYKIVEAEVRKAHENKHRYTKLKNKCEQLQKDVDIISQEIEKLNTENHSNIKIETNKMILEVVMKKMKRMDELSRTLAKLDELRSDILFKKVNKLQHDNRRVSIQEIGRDAEAKRVALKEESEKLRRYVKGLKLKTTLEIKELNEAVNRELNDEERELLAALAKHYMEAEEFDESHVLLKIETIRRELNNFSDAEESSIIKHSRVENSIKEFEQRLPECQTASVVYHKQINEIRNSWLPNLEKLVSAISKNFNENFTKIYPLGEVRLCKDPESFSDWKLEILVQFRKNEEPTILDGTTQSGGEKSVSTAIFLNSLQGLTNAPFRVVDEINQGMDARNERMVHKLIVESACTEKNTSQYFLITPKLLTDLVYHERMSVHCIMAGKFCPDPLVDESFLKFGIAANYV